MVKAINDRARFLHLNYFLIYTGEILLQCYKFKTNYFSFPNISAVFNKFPLQCVQHKFSIHFGLVWNEMQSSFPIRTEASRNHDDGAPAHGKAC